MVVLDSVSKVYPGQDAPAVDDVSFEVARGEMIALVGESGCGKTTTLKLINRLHEPTAGRILVDGQDVLDQDPVQLRRGIGYAFQGVGLFPHYSVAENIAVVPRLLRWSKQDIERRIVETLELVNLAPDDFRDRYPHEMSGGQRQRIGLARALAVEPAVLLMDEPFGALDPLTRDQLEVEFKAIQERLNTTVIMVTHDMGEAFLLCDRVAVMLGGKLLQIGTPHELLNAPADDFVRHLAAMPKRRADQMERVAQGAAE